MTGNICWPSTWPTFDFSVLCEFRGRLLHYAATERLLARLLEAARESGLVKARGRQRTDSTHVLAAVRDLNRLELQGETLRDVERDHRRGPRVAARGRPARVARAL